MVINKQELIELTVCLLRTGLPDEIDLDVSLYWDVMFETRYDTQNEPTGELTLGDLEHDWERVRAIGRAPESFVPTALMWLGNVIRAACEWPPIDQRLRK